MKDLKTRLDEQHERLKKIVVEARKAHPVERRKAFVELNPIIKRVKEIEKEIDSFQEKYFINEKNTITSLGKVGRAIDTDFAIIEIKYARGFLERVADSLSVASDSLRSKEEI